jgi:hypothetical protein
MKRSERDMAHAIAWMKQHRGDAFCATELVALMNEVRAEAKAAAYADAARYVNRFDMYEACEMHSHFAKKAKRARSARPVSHTAKLLEPAAPLTIEPSRLEQIGKEHGRCEVCGWTLAKTREDGCAPGDCSYRPEEGSPEWHRIQARREPAAPPAPVTYRAGTVPPRIEVGMVLRSPHTTSCSWRVAHVTIDRAWLVRDDDRDRFDAPLWDIADMPLAHDWTEPGGDGGDDDEA